MSSKEEVLYRYRDDSLFPDNKSILFTKNDALQAMSEYAEQEAIAFKDWCDTNAWVNDYQEQCAHTTEELYTLYKSQTKQILQ